MLKPVTLLTRPTLAAYLTHPPESAEPASLPRDAPFPCRVLTSKASST